MSTTDSQTTEQLPDLDHTSNPTSSELQEPLSNGTQDSGVTSEPDSGKPDPVSSSQGGKRKSVWRQRARQSETTSTSTTATTTGSGSVSIVSPSSSISSPTPSSPSPSSPAFTSSSATTTSDDSKKKRKQIYSKRQLLSLSNLPVCLKQPKYMLPDCQRKEISTTAHPAGPPPGLGLGGEEGTMRYRRRGSQDRGEFVKKRTDDQPQRPLQSRTRDRYSSWRDHREGEDGNPIADEGTEPERRERRDEGRRGYDEHSGYDRRDHRHDGYYDGGEEATPEWFTAEPGSTDFDFQAAVLDRDADRWATDKGTSSTSTTTSDKGKIPTPATISSTSTSISTTTSSTPGTTSTISASGSSGTKSKKISDEDAEVEALSVATSPDFDPRLIGLLGKLQFSPKQLKQLEDLKAKVGLDKPMTSSLSAPDLAREAALHALPRSSTGPAPTAPTPDVTEEDRLALGKWFPQLQSPTPATPTLEPPATSNIPSKKSAQSSSWSSKWGFVLEDDAPSSPQSTASSGLSQLSLQSQPYGKQPFGLSHPLPTSLPGIPLTHSVSAPSTQLSIQPAMHQREAEQERHRKEMAKLASVERDGRKHDKDKDKEDERSPGMVRVNVEDLFKTLQNTALPPLPSMPQTTKEKEEKERAERAAAAHAAFAAPRYSQRAQYQLQQQSQLGQIPQQQLDPKLAYSSRRELSGTPRTTDLHHSFSGSTIGGGTHDPSHERSHSFTHHSRSHHSHGHSTQPPSHLLPQSATPSSTPTSSVPPQASHRSSQSQGSYEALRESGHKSTTDSSTSGERERTSSRDSSSHHHSHHGSYSGSDSQHKSHHRGFSSDYRSSGPAPHMSSSDSRSPAFFPPAFPLHFPHTSHGYNYHSSSSYQMRKSHGGSSSGSGTSGTTGSSTSADPSSGSLERERDRERERERERRERERSLHGHSSGHDQRIQQAQQQAAQQQVAQQSAQQSAQQPQSQSQQQTSGSTSSSSLSSTQPKEAGRGGDPLALIDGFLGPSNGSATSDVEKWLGRGGHMMSHQSQQQQQQQQQRRPTRGGPPQHMPPMPLPLPMPMPMPMPMMPIPGLAPKALMRSSSTPHPHGYHAHGSHGYAGYGQHAPDPMMGSTHGLAMPHSHGHSSHIPHHTSHTSLAHLHGPPSSSTSGSSPVNTNGGGSVSASLPQIIVSQTHGPSSSTPKLHSPLPHPSASSFPLHSPTKPSAGMPTS